MPLMGILLAGAGGDFLWHIKYFWILSFCSALNNYQIFLIMNFKRNIARELFLISLIIIIFIKWGRRQGPPWPRLSSHLLLWYTSSLYPTTCIPVSCPIPIPSPFFSLPITVLTHHHSILFLYLHLTPHLPVINPSPHPRRASCHTIWSFVWMMAIDNHVVAIHTGYTTICTRINISVLFPTHHDVPPVTWPGLSSGIVSVRENNRMRNASIKSFIKIVLYRSSS